MIRIRQGGVPLFQRRYTIENEPWVRDPDEMYVVWRTEPWPHWEHADDKFVRVFPPPDGRTEWMAAVYTERGTELHAFDYRIFDGEGAKELAFRWAGERFRKRNRPDRTEPVLRGL